MYCKKNMFLLCAVNQRGQLQSPVTVPLASPCAPREEVEELEERLKLPEPTTVTVGTCWSEATQ